MKRLAITAAAAAILAAPAFAATQDFKFELSYNAAALETSQTAAAEYDRIAEQVAERCTSEHTHSRMGRIYETHAARICMTRTMDRAVRQIGHAQLSEIHADRRSGR